MVLLSSSSAVPIGVADCAPRGQPRGDWPESRWRPVPRSCPAERARRPRSQHLRTHRRGILARACYAGQRVSGKLDAVEIKAARGMAGTPPPKHGPVILALKGLNRKARGWRREAQRRDASPGWRPTLGGGSRGLGEGTHRPRPRRRSSPGGAVPAKSVGPGTSPAIPVKMHRDFAPLPPHWEILGSGGEK